MHLDQILLADDGAEAPILRYHGFAEFVQPGFEDLLDARILQLVAHGARLALRLALLAISFR
jgi:hypothetical protein